MTALALFHHCREAGIILAADGDGITFDAPAGAITPAIQGKLKAHKPELLAVLRGDYLNAAVALVKRVADPEHQQHLIYLFDERAGIGQHDGNLSRGEAERHAYIELARTIERSNV